MKKSTESVSQRLESPKIGPVAIDKSDEYLAITNIKNVLTTYLSDISLWNVKHNKAYIERSYNSSSRSKTDLNYILYHMYNKI